MHHLDDVYVPYYYITGTEVRQVTTGDFRPNGSPDQIAVPPQAMVMTREAARALFKTPSSQVLH